MGDHPPTDPSSLRELQSVYSQFRDHCSLQRNETDVAVFEAIRSKHPNVHITVVDADECDLFEYAEAGHAKSSLVWEDHHFFAIRSYKAPKTRLAEGQGALNDYVRFGRCNFDFNGTDWVFYTARWQNVFESERRRYYVLSSGQDLDEEGHSASVDAMILTIGKWTSELHKEIYVFDDGDWTKSPLLWEAVQTAKWDDVIIEPTMKEALIRDVHSFFDSRALFQEYAVPWKRGIILHGTPGCGKTISIKALMNSLEKRSPPVASLYVKSFHCCAGEQYSIRQIFLRAREMAPCLLIFEDLDSLVKNKVRSYFLNEVDGLENNDGILMIGSTNHLERLDPGISKRPSRFDRKYHYTMPGEQERILYCNYWKQKVDRSSNVDFDPEISTFVAKSTEGWSYAYLKELFVQTLLTLAFGGDGEQDVGGDGVRAPVEDKDADEEIKAIDADGKTRRMPEIEIPARLQNNKLLQILQKQLVALWKDMDSSENAEKGDEVDDDDKDKDKDNDDDDDDDEDKPCGTC